MALRGGMGCLISIFKVWPDKKIIQWEKNAESKGRGVSCTTDIIFNSEPGVVNNSEVFRAGNFWYCLDTLELPRTRKSFI